MCASQFLIGLCTMQSQFLIGLCTMQVMFIGFKTYYDYRYQQDIRALIIEWEHKKNMERIKNIGRE